MIDHIKEQRDEARAEVERLRKDAERYRFVKDYDNPNNPIAICRFEESGWDGQWVIEHDPDAAIDAALAAKGE